jgi:hypothetical protein
MLAKWTTDAIAESKIKAIGIGFRYVKGLEIAKIDIAGSRRNNARLREQWNEDLSVEYGVAMADGDTFPAPVLREVSGGTYKYFVLSGNHRIGAATMLNDKMIDAYIVEGDDEMAFEIITRSANRWMGDRQTKEEAVEHARALIAKYNRPQQEVAKLFGLKPNWLSNALRAEDTRDEMEKLGLHSRELPRATILHLSQLSDNERVFRKAGYLASKFKLPAERVKDIVIAAKGQKSEQGAIDVLKRVEDDLRSETAVATVAAASPVYTRPERTRLFQYVNTLHNFLNTGRSGQPFATLEQIGVTSVHDRHELRERFRSVRVHMDEMFRHAEKATLSKNGKKPRAR